MRCASIVLAFVLFGPSIGAAQERALAEPAVQVYQEVRHHPVFENSLVRIRIDGTVAEGSSTESGPDAWWWRRAESEHVLRNVGARAVDFVEIDWP